MTDTRRGEAADTARAAGDRLLCFCEKIPHEVFRDHVARHPDASFEETCRRTGLGSQCTACLLNAENLFIETVTSPAVREAAAPRREARRRLAFDRRVLYRLVDRFSPRISRVVYGINPVLGGPGVRTVLHVANSIPRAIGPRSPTFELRVRVRDADGNEIRSERHEVPTGERLTVDLTERLGDAAGAGLAAGGCWLEYRARRPGYLGTIRPHIAVVTPVAMAAIHSIGAGHRTLFHRTVFANDAERQLVSVVNCAAREEGVRIELRDGAAVVGLVEARVPAFGARALELPRPATARPVDVVGLADEETRWHMVVCAGDPPRISLDHA